MYRLNHKPNVRELNAIVEHHNTHYIDYCKVWFANGTTKDYPNTQPWVDYYKADDIMIDFYNPNIGGGNGQFGKMGIIRAKRVVLPIDRNKKICYNTHGKRSTIQWK